MVFQNDILAGSSGGSGTSTAVHTIGQSIRFNSADDGNMYRVVGSGGNTKTWTFSGWFKLGLLGSQRSASPFLWSGYQDGSNRLQLMLDNSVGSGAAGDFLCLYSSTSGNIFQTTRVFRDPSAWYHIVVVSDTSNAVASERIRLYINGVRETSFSTINYPSLNADLAWNKDGSTWYLGKYYSGSGSGTYNYDGYMAELVNLDGTATDCNSFGEFSSGIWIPKDVSGLTFGNKGWYIDGRDSADLGDDESGNNNDFTTSGIAAHDQVSDSPTNNFAVFNPVMTNDADFEFSEGNLKLDMNTNKSWYVGAGASMSMTSGKWYWESYWNSGDQYTIWGILDTEQLHALAGSSGSTTIYSLNFNGIQPNTSGTNDQYRQGASVVATGQGGSPGGIWQFALDMDNKKMWLGYNGTWVGSGDPSGGTNETWSSTYIASSSYTPANAGYQISQHSILTYNFGQEGTFAGNITAGNNSDGNGIGNFKYSVPSGYKALCTRNLGS